MKLKIFLGILMILIIPLVAATEFFGNLSTHPSFNVMDIEEQNDSTIATNNGGRGYENNRWNTIIIKPPANPPATNTETKFEKISDENLTKNLKETKNNQTNIDIVEKSEKKDSSSLTGAFIGFTGQNNWGHLAVIVTILAVLLGIYFWRKKISSR